MLKPKLRYKIQRHEIKHHPRALSHIPTSAHQGSVETYQKNRKPYAIFFRQPTSETIDGIL